MYKCQCFNVTFFSEVPSFKYPHCNEKGLETKKGSLKYNLNIQSCGNDVFWCYISMVLCFLKWQEHFGERQRQKRIITSRWKAEPHSRRTYGEMHGTGGPAVRAGEELSGVSRMLLKLHLLASKEITLALLTGLSSVPGQNNHRVKPQAAAVPSDIGQGRTGTGLASWVSVCFVRFILHPASVIMIIFNRQSMQKKLSKINAAVNISINRVPQHRKSTQKVMGFLRLPQMALWNWP